MIFNACKYTPQGGSIQVRLGSQNQHALVEISDSGIGIPEDELPRIFEEFFRARNAKKIEKDGTGLGLSIAKQVVERHAGKIWVTSKEGKGTTFSFTLPLP